ncbi:MAG: SRPBCC family protein, partial [Acidobacteriota bacterium]|nr:SRPBCC family protein [Acidobacteriota bacterium]
MPIIEVFTLIAAPVELCFDLASDIDIHIASTEGTNEKAIAGIQGGLISLGEQVTWEARHFGIRQKLTSRVTIFDRPHHFRDSQVSGPFHHFDHDHFFRFESGVTVMQDLFNYQSPFGLFGRVADSWFLQSY